MYSSKIYKYLQVVFIVCLYLFCCVGCAEKPQFLGGESSRLPCWQGLCPGQRVTAEETIERLKTIEGVEYFNYDVEISHIAFTWINKSHCTTTVSCRVYGDIYFDSETLSHIRLKTDYEITLGEFIREMGEPQCVNIYSVDISNDDENMILRYPLRGLIVDPAGLADKTHRIDPGVGIESFTLIDRRLLCVSYKVATDNNKIYPWKGFDAEYLK